MFGSRQEKKSLSVIKETFHCIRSQVAIEDISTTLECNKLQMKDIFKSGPNFSSYCLLKQGIF